MLPLIKDSSLLTTLIRNFYRGSLNYNIESENLHQMTWSKQDEFLNATVRHSLLKKYPVRSEFVRLFFKKLITFLERHQEVHDDIYEYLCVMMNKPPEKFCFRHYVIGDGLNSVITLKETNNMVINGTTGLRTWEAAIMLADWALCNIDLFKSKKVLELGSGVGLTGITIAKFCQPCCIILSDCHAEVLNALEENIAINIPSLQCQQLLENILFQSSSQTVGVMNLDWNNIDNLSIELIPDIIVGSDIIYDPSIIEPLCNVLSTFCNKNKNVDIFIAGVNRNEDTFSLFLDKLGKIKLQFDRIVHSSYGFVEWDLKVQHYLLHINKKL